MSAMLDQAPAQVMLADGVALLRLDRPAVGNALSTELVEALHTALDQVLGDASIHTIILSGAGRHFCTGFDLSGLDTASDADLLARLIAIERLLDRLWRAPVRTAAVASGRCWGAGADLIAVCDQRIVTADASFRFPGAGFGIVLGSRRLALRVGLDRARRLITQGDTLDATSALEAGLVTALSAPTAPTTAAPEGFSAEAAHCLSLLGPAPAIDRDTLGQIRLATLRALETSGQAESDADLAALVRSAARPGLQSRIRAYRDRVQASRTRT